MMTLNDLYLRYPIMQHNSHSLRAFTKEKFQRILNKKNFTPTVKYVEALKNINLVLKSNTRLGVIGPNGAGKTTLLRVLAGIYPPSEGSIEINGKVSSLTDFTLGMDANLTGRKNIIFRLVYMGFTFKQANQYIEDIIEFSGLKDKIDLPMYTYSTGMFLRLAFSISTHFSPEILILDEVIGAGDQAFREKVLKRTENLLENSRLVILSSHDLGAIQKYCSSVIFMAKGEIISQGSPKDVIEEYLEFSKTQEAQ